MDKKDILRKAGELAKSPDPTKAGFRKLKKGEKIKEQPCFFKKRTP